jgi:exodeoxyribonuclease VII small subunit
VTAEPLSGDERSFEELERELENVVERLERGDVPVDDAIALFRRGEELYRECVSRLEAAELEVETLVPAEPGEADSHDDRDRASRHGV